jgi:AraC family transcriptional regulator, regulatory protein of adaptative response / methylated-DNA-[protein]-cysteine methyltransferase
MDVQAQFNFNRIADAIDFIKNNFDKQPSLEDIATHVHMSTFHFQKMFTEWAGVSPKKFLQYITLAYAKDLLREKQATLFDTTFETGLSSTSRLHDLFINIVGMSPAEYKNGGESLIIHYSFAETNFGKIIIASTPKGICYTAFFEDENEGVTLLKARFPNAKYTCIAENMHGQVVSFFCKNFSDVVSLNLHLKGTEFQLRVWEMLLSIPMGQLTTYGNIATKINNPKAARAVGTAIGDNPIAYIIPCHRVIQSTGIFGGYMWGPKRKTAILGWEAAKTDMDNH